ncbi:MAG TPA: non-ribosomal peptide synthase/polyketide synthase [Thermoanaerobaculia bacterium]|jgi:amino acid adenylation domain-containing protein|nr:non-ribosomal peptide synthase/polyketide synthase [Thermoanaerobaculia bacterium]
MNVDDLSHISPELRALLLLKLKGESKSRDDIARQKRVGEAPRFPLSFAQARLWFLDQFIPRRSAYNVPMVLAIDGPLEVPSLRAALDQIVARHEILRTTYSIEVGEQILHPAAPLPLQVVDLSAAFGDAEPRAAAKIRERIEVPFDLQTGPMLRASLFRLAPERHLLLVNIHHIATDGWSAGVLIREIEALYRSDLAGTPAKLPELPVQYLDFAVWQRRRVEGPARDRRVAYWTAKLEGVQQLELPLDRPRPKRQSYAGGKADLAIAAETVEALRAVGRREQVTAYTALLAAFATLLSRYSGQKDVVVGTPFANRQRPELENLVGFFVNTLPLRTAVDHWLSARALFRSVRETVVEAQEHQELPFEVIVEELGVARDTSHPPIFQVVFNFQALASGGAPPDAAVAGDEGVRFTYRDVTTESAKFDLALAIGEVAGAYLGNLVYDAHLFDRGTAERLGAHFQNLLSGMLAAPDAPLRDLEILSPEERQELRSGRQGRAARDLGTAALGAAALGAAEPSENLLTGGFETQVHTAPDAVALVFADEHWSYDALNRRANRLAHRLRRRGVGPEVRVGLCYERSATLIVGLLGILKAGGVYVPLDPSYPQERLCFIAEDAGLTLILTADRHADRLPREIEQDTAWPEARDTPDLDPPASASPDNGVYVIYTSGSTGKPKGVVISHRNVLRLFDLTQAVFGFERSDVWTLFHSYAFDFSVWEIWGALLFGGRLVVTPYWISRSPTDFRRLLADEAVTVLNQSPSAFRQLVNERQEGEEDDAFALRYVIFGAEALDWQILEPWFARHGAAARLVNMYGITETTVHVTHRVIDPAELPFGSPVGPAIDDLDLYLRDDDGNLVPIGVPGEVFVAGPGLSRGYLGRPDLTAERFVPNPYARQPGDRLYKTGDKARFLANGETIFLGRNDDQVKIRGFRIELGEIQAALVDLPSVKDALVLAAKNPQGEDFLAAYLIPARGELNLRQLRDSLLRVLPEYMVPARFVLLERFPMTAHGKLDRRALPEAWEARQRLDGGERASLQSVTEEALAAVWSEVLSGVEVGRDDNFFALGGDSISSLRVLGIARARGIELSLQDLFQLQTVKLLAQEVSRQRAVGALGAAEEGAAAYQPFALVAPEVRRRLPDDVEDAYPLSKLQLGMLYEMRMTPELMPYHNVDSMTLRGTFERAAFLSAVRMLVARHPIFRTSLHVSGYGEPLQLVHQEAALLVEWHDLRGMPSDEQRSLIDLHVERERRNAFDLKVPGLLRFAVHQLDDRHVQFALTECHAILDGWSLTSAIAEIFDRHARIVDDGDLLPLAPPKLRFAEFVAQERNLLVSGAARGYWRQRLSGFLLREVPRWPSERHAAAAGDEVTLNEVVWTLPADQVEGLRRAARAAQVPLKSVFLAAHAKVLGRLLGTDDVVIGMQANGRPEAEGGDEVYGLFLNAMPLRAPVREGTWQDLIRQVFQAEWEALPHRAFPMASIQEMTGGAALFEIFFNFVSFRSLEKVVRSRLVEVVGESRFVEPHHFPLLAGFNMDPISGDVTAVLQSARREFPRAQLLAFERYYRAAFGAILAATDEAGETEGGRHELWNGLPAAELQWLCREVNQDGRGLRDSSVLQELFDLRQDRETSTFVLDPWLQPLPLGAIGELYLSGSSVGLSQPHPEAAARRFVPDPYGLDSSHGGPGARLFRTGLLARFQTDGGLALAGWAPGQMRDSELAYWRTRLAGLPILDLPTDHPRPVAPTIGTTGGSVAVPYALSAPQTAALHSQAGPREGSLAALLLASCQALLGRYAGQTDVVVGMQTPGAGSLRNAQPIRSDLSGTFSELAEHVRQAILDAREHAELPLEQIAESLGFAVDPSRSPLFDVLFVDRTAAPAAPTSRFDLVFTLERSAPEIQGRIEGRRDLFDPPTLHRLAEHWTTLLAGIIEEPESAIAALSVLSAGERHQILVEWNATAAVYPDLDGLSRAIEAQVERTPDAVALVFAESALSFAALNARANRLAHRLRRLGVGPEVPVAIAAERSLELVVGLLAILKAGGAYVPFDPSYPPQRLAFMLDALLAATHSAVLLTQTGVAEMSPSTAHGARPALERIVLDAEIAPPVAADEARNLGGSWAAERMAYVILTSGSTGRPKGVVNTHRGILNRLFWTQRQYRLTTADRVMQKTPMSFDVSVWEFFWPLLAGAQLVIARPGGHRDSTYLADLIAEQGITLMHFVPAMLEAFLREPDLSGCASLRTVLASGEALPPALAERFTERLGSFGTGLHNLYGPTEAAVDVTAYRWQPATAEAHTMPIGRPVSNTRLHVLDRDFRPLPAGVPGQLMIGGVQLARGYLGRPDLTAAAFVPDPLGVEPGARLYRTGDLARYRPDGEIVFLGRIDHQVKLRGFRIELGEIESVLRSLPGVEDAVVLLRTGERGNARLVAYVVGTRGEAPTAEALRRTVAERLPDYMVPSAFVLLASLPLSANGKLDRAALPEPPEQETAEYAPPATLTEEVLAAVWSEVLGVANVSRTDSFFNLGGDSIFSLRAVASAEERGIPFNLQKLYEHATLALLAREIDRGAVQEEQEERSTPFSLISEAVRSALPEDAVDAYPMVRLQLGMLYHMRRDPELLPYHNVDSGLFRGSLDRDAFFQAVQLVVDRHPILRTGFHLETYAEPLQVVHRTAVLPVAWHDLRGLDTDAQEADLGAFFAGERQRLFDLAKPPLLRYAVHVLTDDTFRFTMTENHIALDGWSFNSILAEVFAHHFRLVAGETSVPRPTPEPPYREFVRLERKAIESEASRSFWRDVVADCPRLLVAGGEAPEVELFKRVEVVFSKDEATALQRAARARMVPFKTVLLAAHVKVLALLAGADEIVTGLVANGRPEAAGGSDVYGLFLNTVPFRIRVEEDEEWADLIVRTFDAERRILPHRRVPTSVIQADYGAAALYDVMFNYISFHSLRSVLERSDFAFLGEVRSSAPTHYPLAVDFNLNPIDGELLLILEAGTRKTSRQQLEAVGRLYRQVLSSLAADRPLTQAEIPLGILASRPPLDAVEPDFESTPYEAPSTPTEEVLAAVWSEMLGVEPVGRNDSFFSLGGDSILSLRLLAATEERHLALDLKTLYETPTLRDLALAIDRGEARGAPLVASAPFSLISAAVRSRLPADAVDAYPMVKLQLGMLYHMKLDPELMPYHNVNSGLFRARLDREAFVQAVQLVVDRHAILRTGFHLDTYGEPLQVVHRTATMPIVWEDLRALDPADRTATVQAYFDGERKGLLDLARPPIVRYAVHLVGDDLLHFTMTENHIALDGWSFHAILAEMFGYHYRILAGEEIVPLPPPEPSYREFVRLELEAIRSEPSLAYWRELLSDSPRFLVGAEVHSEGAEDSADEELFKHVEVAFSAEESSALVRSARRFKVPLKSVMLAAHVKALSLLARSEEVVTGLVVNGRPETAGGSEIFGLFLNTVPFRMRVGAEATWADLVVQAFEAERRMLPHRRVPMSVIQEDYGKPALYEVMFNYVNFHSVRSVLEREDFTFVGESRSAAPSHYPLAVDFNLDPVTGDLLLILESGTRKVSLRQLEAVGRLYRQVLASLAAGRAVVLDDAPADVVLGLPPLDRTAMEGPATDLLAFLDLPTDYPRRTPPGTAVRTLDIAFPEGTSEAAALAAFQALLGRYSGQTDVAVAALLGGAPHGTSEVTLVVEEDCRSGRIEARRDLFDSTTIKRMAGHLVRLIEQMRIAPDSMVALLPLVGPAERHQTVIEWSTGLGGVPKPDRSQTVVERFQDQCLRAPDVIAVDDQGRQMSYRALDRRSDRLAERLRTLGVGPETVTGLLLERSLEAVISILGILKSGGAYLPLDGAQPTERLAGMVGETGAGVLVTGELPNGLENLLAALDPRPRVVVLESSGDLSGTDKGQDGGGTLAPTFRENLAYVIYTSGSTGRPKGVMVDHGAALSLIASLDATLLGRRGLGFRVSQNSALIFDASLEELLQLLLGHTLVVLPEEVRRNPDELPDYLLRHGVQFFSGTPSQFRPILATGLLAKPSAVELISIGGEALDEALWQKLAESGVEVYNTYGPTEATVESVYCRIDPGISQPMIGRALPSRRTVVLDRFQQPQPIGVAGQLALGGAGLARGYLNRPGETAERFVPDAFGGETGGRLYLTGDRVRTLADGTLEFLGRIDHQVKLRGYRIELGEIETALRSHPGVADAVVLLRSTDQGEPRLVAWVVAGTDGMPESGELRRVLSSRLPDYMVPSVFVPLDRLPLTPGGKLDRAALKVLPQGETAPVEPLKPQEELLAGIWCILLGLPRVGLDDDFFSLGGHSLLATQMVSRIRSVFAVEIPLRTIFEAPTLALLAHRIDEAARAGLPTLPPIEPRPADLLQVPVSFAQRRLWFLDQLLPDSRAYNIPNALRVVGRLDVAALAAGFAEIVRRHESLRTTFRLDDGEPVQVVSPTGNVSLGRMDLSHLAAAGREREAHRLADQDLRRPFSLLSGPLLRTTLIRLAAEDHLLLIVTHHIVSDGWSLEILIRELGTLYTAFSQDRPSPLPELAVQYPDFSLWQQRLGGQFLENEARYWQEMLRGLATLDLATDRPRPAVYTDGGAAFGIELGALSGALRTLARETGVTMFMTLLAAVQMLLHRYTGQTDIAVGTPIAGRTHLHTEDLIGFFVNTLVLRTDLAADSRGGALSPRALLSRVRETTLAAYAHQNVPFERLVEVLNPDRDLSRSPLFDVELIVHHPSGTLPAPAGLRFEPFPGQDSAAQFDLSLAFEEGPGILRGEVVYRVDLFDRSTIQRLAGHLAQLLQGLVEKPDGELAALPLLTAPERHQCLTDWNDTAVASRDEGLSFQELFESQVRRVPDAIAAICGEELISYREIGARARRLAGRLAARGARPETVVALLASRGLPLLTAILAVFETGAAYVPLDPLHPVHRQRQVLRQSGACLLIAERGLADGLAAEAEGPALAPILGLEDLLGLEEREEDGRHLDAARRDPRHLAYVIFTSGSTGVPKGAMIEQRGMMNHLRAKVEDLLLRPADVIVQNASQCFDISVWQFLSGLLVGGRVNVVRDGIAHDARRLLALVQEDGATILEIVPSMLRGLLDTLEAEGWGLSLPHLRWLMVTGEALPEDVTRRWLAAFPSIPLLNAYGPTECSDDVTHHAIRYAAEIDGPSLPIGRPLRNLRIDLLDRHRQPVPAGVPGELCVGGIGVGRGYLDDPARTAAAFVPDPEGALRGDPGGRLYRTGDLARRTSEGVIEFLGRIDHQVKLRGFRIELGEIESILRLHPEVTDAAVLLRAEKLRGPELVAYVAADVGGTPLPVELRRFLGERLPDYMVPSIYVFLDHLPLTPNGKLDRSALPEPELESATGDAGGTPQTFYEELLAGIWSTLLGLPRVGLDDDFFALGGHSLLATQVVSRIRSVLAVEIPLRTIFEAPTLARLARRIDEAARAGEPALPPIEPRPADLRQVPVSFAQRRLWFLDQLLPDSPAYNIPTALRAIGRLDVASLAAGFAEIVRRHESLRTTFRLDDGEPVQVVSPTGKVPLRGMDLSRLAPAEREREAHRLADQDVRRPFSLLSGPLLRTHLIRLAAEEHLLLIATHHIVSDGWSTGILLRELSHLYRNASQGLAVPLPELAIQYPDFALWQQSWLAGAVLDAEIAYWTRQLKSLATLDLPTDHPRRPVTMEAGAGYSFELPPPLSARFKALARAEGVTLFMALVAAFQLLLHRYTGQTDVAVGTPVAGRNLLNTEDLIGFFVNTLVLRTDLSPAPATVALGARELFARLRETTLGAYAHQSAPFEKLVEALNPVRDLSRSPLFDVLFALHNQPIEDSTIEDLRFEGYDADSGVVQFDLSWALFEAEGALGGEIAYRTDLFEAVTIERMVGHFARLLESLAAQPGADIGALPLLTDAEHHQILAEWNATAAVHPDFDGLSRAIEAQVERTPDAVALVFEESALSFASLNARANRLARRLRRLGVGPEVPVAIAAERSLELVVGLLAILKAGGAYVPFDPSYPPRRLAFMLDALLAATHPTVAAVLLTQAGVAEISPSTEAGAHPALERIALDAEIATPVADDEARNLGGTFAAERMAYVIFTSGSTGRPKGVVNTHRGILNRLFWTQWQYRLTTADRVMQKTPMSFDVSVWEFFWPLLAGAQLVIARPGGHRDSVYLADLIVERGITLMHFVPAMLEAFLREPDLSGCVSLRTVLASGEALPPELAQRFAERLGSLGTELHNLYGPTEAAVEVSAYRYRPALDAGRAVPIGRPAANTRLHVLDRDFRPLPTGVPGQLMIGGVQLARGYLGGPDLTAAAFVPDPLGVEPGARLYRTGDLARYRPDGEIVFLGRIDHQVKLRGFRIELGEIESVLRSLPGVEDAVVLLRTGERGNARLVAYVVGTAGEAGTEPVAEELRRTAAERLPDYMVPSAFVLLDRLPLNPNGKVDRAALPEPESTTAGDTGDAEGTPQTFNEELLAGIWSTLLGLPRVGVDDDFFGLGGHSLLATQVVSRIRDVLAVEIPLRTIFEAPTIARLARRIDEAARASLPTLPPIEPRPGGLRLAPMPVSFAQRRLWFLDQLMPDSPAYNIPTALRIVGRLDVSALATGFAEIVRRHESLRTTFLLDDGEPVQVVSPTGKVPLGRMDLSHLAAAGREREAHRLAEEDARRPFSLLSGPLLRTTLIRLAAEEHLLLIATHHIVSDGWSAGILVRELGALYTAFSQGRSSPLPELAVQYPDFALWQQSWVAGEVLDAEIAYWTRQLKSLGRLDLATDHPRLPTLTEGGASCFFELPELLSARFKALARAEGVTMFMALVAVFKLLLHRYTAQTDVTVGTPVAGRNLLHTEDLIGFFVNTLVLRTDLSPAPAATKLGARELFARVRETTLGAYAHQSAPFEKLVEALNPERDLSRTPLIDVMFSFHNPSPGASAIEGLRFEDFPEESQSARFDLSWTLAEISGKLFGETLFKIDCFDPATIRRMTGHFAVLLAGIVSDPDLGIAELPLLAAAERHQLLAEWRDTEKHFGDESTLVALFQRQALRTPDAIAVHDDSSSLTYFELNRQAHRLAHLLVSRGVGPEKRVAVFMERSPARIVGLLAILKAGGAFVPIDPEYPRERILWMLEDSAATVILTRSEEARRLPQSQAPVVKLDAPFGSGGTEDDPFSDLDLDHPAYVIYTSGSTGRPKGVTVSHRAISNHMRWQQESYPLGPDDVVLHKTPMSFDPAVCEFFAPLWVGARLALAGPGAHRDPAYLVAEMQRYGVSALQVVPTLLRALIEEPGFPGCVSLHRIYCGGEALPLDLFESLHRVWKGTAINVYGPAEAAIRTTSWHWRSGDPRDRDHTSVPLGRPIPNAHVALLDSTLHPVPVGVPGEIFIGGTGLARGYHRRPDLTAERFLPTAEGGFGARLYRSGDRARWLPDGTLEFLGRLDHQVKLRGVRIELGEIESVLRSVAGVDEAVVLLRDAERGNGRLVAYVVPAPGTAPTADDLRRAAGVALPETLVPSIYVFLDRLPLSPNGKLDRSSLARVATDESTATDGYRPPRDRTEIELARIWEELLAVDRVGLDDNFFHLGGHSLLAVSLVARIGRRLGQTIPLTAIFQEPTVENLAALLRKTGESGSRAPSILIPLHRGGDASPWFFVHPVGGQVHWYLELARRLGGDIPVYGLQAPGLTEGGPVLDDVPRIAETYLSVVREIQPEGPYFLAGWSAGGAIAFEMARSLQASGHQIGALVLIDAPFSGAPTFERDDDEVSTWTDMVAEIAGTVGVDQDALRRTLLALDPARRAAYVAGDLDRRGLLPSGLGAEHLERMLAVHVATSRAVRSYAPPLYPGSGVLVRAADTLAEQYGALPDQAFGWAPFFVGDLTTHDVSGDHYSILADERVAALASVLDTLRSDERAPERPTLER